MDRRKLIEQVRVFSRERVPSLEGAAVVLAASTAVVAQQPSAGGTPGSEYYPLKAGNKWVYKVGDTTTIEMKVEKVDAGEATLNTYVNQKQVPHLFIGSGATIFNDPKHYPWTMSWTPHYASEAEIYARYILSTKPDARIGVLSQNDDLGRDYLMGLKRGLGAKASSMIVASLTYDTTDPTVDSQVVSLRASGADVFMIFSVPKFAAQAIRKAYDIDWRPQEFVSSVGSSIAGAIRPAGFEAAKGIISAAYQKDPADPQWRDDPAMKAWNVWMDRYNPHVDKSDYYAPYGYNVGYAVVQLLKQCGDNLTRANIMKQASHLDMELPLLLPGIRLKTTPTDLRPIKQMRLVRFDGQRYVLFSDVLTSE